MLALLASMMMFGFNPSVLTVPVVYAQEIDAKSWTVDELKSLATDKAKEHNLNVEHFMKVIECESGWNPSTTGDNETSFGLAQLHYPTRDWGIATSSAYDPRISLEIMASAWQRNEYARWSCWRMYYGTSLAILPN